MGSMAFNETMMETRPGREEEEPSLFIPLFSSLMRLLFLRLSIGQPKQLANRTLPRAYVSLGNLEREYFSYLRD